MNRKVVVTGAAGFIGRNLCVALARDADVEPIQITRRDGPTEIRDKLQDATHVFHLAGANRPSDPADFERVNQGFTSTIARICEESKTRPLIAYSSSNKAAENTPYGRSKRRGEEELEAYADSGGSAVLYRLPNVFGKWSRPNYNSAVATFCYNIARDLPIEIHDPNAVIRLVYVDDVVREFVSLLDIPLGSGLLRREVSPVFECTVGELASRIRALRSGRKTLCMPDLSDLLNDRLNSTFVSFLPMGALDSALAERADDRGRLAELIKSPHLGQIFVSTTRPGITRGNHFHHSKVEKFVVLSGYGQISLRILGQDAVHRYQVSGDEWKAVDIPPGTIHNISNTGKTDLVVLFWAAQVFDPGAPDTYQEMV